MTRDILKYDGGKPIENGHAFVFKGADMMGDKFETAGVRERGGDGDCEGGRSVRCRGAGKVLGDGEGGLHGGGG